MMNIAILGATSQIARDLIISFSSAEDIKLHLFSRRPADVHQWLSWRGLAGRHVNLGFADFSKHAFNAIINFVGVGNPAQAAAMGNLIFDVTLHFDQMVLDYLQLYPTCCYLFLSSGAAYGSGFSEPANNNTQALVSINSLTPHEWYGVAKMHAECRHRAHPELAIIDIRVFNYFSHTQDLSARFLITDMVRAIRDKQVLVTSSDYIVRDFLHPDDFHQLCSSVLSAPAANSAVDCYTRAPIDKPNLLAAMQEAFGLQYRTTEATASVNATGGKPHYYSLNRRAEDFGYKPSMTSLDGILRETSAIMENIATKHIQHE
jgi:nucleoside-diphosphate-sugar epimerase